MLRYPLALAPAFVTVGWWQLALWAYGHYECAGNLKGLQPCYVGAFNIQLFLGIGLFWCQLLSWLAVPLSGWLCVRAYAQHHEQHSSGEA